MSKTFLSLCSKTWSRSDSPVSSFHADSRRQSGDRVRSRCSEKNTSALRRAAARMDLLKNLYLTPSSSPWFLDQYGSCDIHLATGCGPWEVPGPTYRMSEVLKSRGIAHHLDDWGPKGGHEWPYWHHQMWEYVGAHF